MIQLQIVNGFMFICLEFKRFGRKLNEMKKEDNDWEILDSSAEKGYENNPIKITINGETYHTPQKYGAICHAILLLVDAINDKKVT